MSRPHKWTEEPPQRECAPTFYLDQHIARARAEMGEARWAELNAEWAAPAGDEERTPPCP